MKLTKYQTNYLKEMMGREVKFQKEETCITFEWYPAKLSAVKITEKIQLDTDGGIYHTRINDGKEQLIYQLEENEDNFIEIKKIKSREFINM